MGLEFPRVVLILGLLVAMVASTCWLHHHAWLESHQDLGCAGLCDPGRPCDCGLAFSEEFPRRYWVTSLLLLGEAVAISLLMTRGRPTGQRARRAIALAAVAYLAVFPLSFSLRDWHGDSEFLDALVLSLASFPVGLPLWPLAWHLVTGIERLPYLGGDPTYGEFSTRIALCFLVLGASAYAQWFLVIPWLTSRLLRWAQGRRAMPRVAGEGTSGGP